MKTIEQVKEYIKKTSILSKKNLGVVLDIDDQEINGARRAYLDLMNYIESEEPNAKDD